jgi:single-stranded-DNA-specific exonuclease
MLKKIFGQKYVWQIKGADSEICQAIFKKFGLSYPVVNVLVARGFKTAEQVSRFLFSNFELDVACGSRLKDGKKTVVRINEAISKKEKILVFGDYDVDGMTSVSIVILALVPLGADINYFLPDRQKDGYGITAKAVERAVKSGYKLIITVDNGTTAHAAADKACELGIDLIITDHHQPKEKLPGVFALVNPHQATCEYPHKNFCGAGVIFKLMHLLYEERGLELPAKIYELLMMGTVADMVPLNFENRYWVRCGIAALRKNMSYSFFCMAKNAGLNPEKDFWSAQDIGFFIAPQLNALGRLENSRDAIKFLVSSEAQVVEEIAPRLKEVNDRRKKIDREIFAEIEGKIKHGEIDLSKEKIIMAADASWPPGVIGLVAGKLLAAYGRPTFLFHLTPEGDAKGSCRSIEKFNVFQALGEVHELLVSFGGHSCAAGLSLKQENLAVLKTRLEAMVAAQVRDEDLVPTIQVDATLSLVDVNAKLLNDLRMLEPFGHANTVPHFLVEQVVLVKRPELLKDLHLKCLIFAEGVIKPVIFFHRPELLELFLQNQEKPFDLLVSLNANEWQGRTRIDFIGLDVRFGGND